MCVIAICERNKVRVWVTHLAVEYWFITEKSYGVIVSLRRINSSINNATVCKCVYTSLSGLDSVSPICDLHFNRFTTALLHMYAFLWAIVGVCVSVYCTFQVCISVMYVCLCLEVIKSVSVTSHYETVISVYLNNSSIYSWKNIWWNIFRD